MRKFSGGTGPWIAGLDVSDRQIAVCVLDAQGVVQERTRLATTPPSVQSWLAGWQPMRVILEVGTHSPWLSRVIQATGHEAIVANARKLRFIFRNESKSDRVDAEALARVGRLDLQLLAPLRHRSAAAQEALAQLRARDVLVQARTRLINHVRGAVKSTGSRLPATGTTAFARRVGPHVPVELQAQLAPLLTLIEQLTHQIRGYDRALEQLAAQRYPETGALRQVAGVGVLTALCFVLTLEDPDRFATGRSVGAFLGLRPKRSDSGERRPQLGITKCGDPMLRRLLVTSAHYILGPFGPDTDLRRWGLRLTAQGGKNAKKRAVVAVARKLAGLLYSLWVHGTVYQPLRAPSMPQSA
jgi:transposase